MKEKLECLKSDFGDLKKKPVMMQAVFIPVLVAELLNLLDEMIVEIEGLKNGENHR